MSRQKTLAFIFRLDDNTFIPKERARCPEGEKKMTTQVQNGYVKTTNGEFYVQTAENNQWGFSLHSDDQSWPGGFGVAGEWVLVPESEVPEAVKEQLGFMLENEEPKRLRAERILKMKATWNTETLCYEADNGWFSSDNGTEWRDERGELLETAEFQKTAIELIGGPEGGTTVA
jgi:hypothetical protein